MLACMSCCCFSYVGGVHCVVNVSPVLPPPQSSYASYASHMLWFATARTLLKDSQCMQFCRKTLTAIMQKQECLEIVGVRRW